MVQDSAAGDNQNNSLGMSVYPLDILIKLFLSKAPDKGPLDGSFRLYLGYLDSIRRRIRSFDSVKNCIVTIGIKITFWLDVS